MEKCTLIGSPNWYLSQVLDCSSDNKVAFGALSSLVVLDSSNILNPKIVHQAHSGKILSVSFPPQGCGNKLLTTADSGDAYVWNLDTEKVALAYKTPQKCSVYGSWSHADKNLIVCVDENGNLVQWKVHLNGVNGKTFKEHSFVVVSCCPHNRELVATGTRQGLVCVVNIKVPGKEYIVHKMRGHDSEVVSLSWCPVRQNIFNPKNNQDCLLLASGAKEKKIFFWRAGGDGLYESFLETPLVPRTQAGLKQWNCVCWQAPEQILVSTVGGEVLSLNVAKFNPKKGSVKAGWVNFSSNHNRCHVVVKSSPWIPKEGESNNDWRLQDSTPQWVWTFGADRVVTGTCSDKNVAPIKLNTIGGAVHSMTISSIDGTSLAIGGADKTIRVVNLSEPQLKTMQTFNQKVSGKVMSLSWHPSKDGWLAYGTSDGRIGIQFTCSVKPPLLFRPFTKESIYAMEWGPSLASIKSSFDTPENSEENEATIKPSNHVLYAVGGGNIAIMDPNKPDHVYEEPFKTVLKTVLKPHSLKAKNKPIGLSDLAWKPDFSLLALGDEAGSIHLFNRSKEELYLVASIKAHSSLIQDISWHPQCCASDTSDMSPQANWLASASNDVNINIFDVSSVFDALEVSQGGDSSLPISDVPCIATLRGHKSRVAKVAWSPHEGGRLLSVSYDYCAQVWDVINRHPVASYHHHSAPVLSCEWSPFNPSLAITAGQEGIVRIWDIQEQEDKLPPAKNKDANNVLSDAKEVKAHIFGNQNEECHAPKIQVKKKEKTLLPLSGPVIQNDDSNYTILKYLLKPPENGDIKFEKDELGDDGNTMPLHYAFFSNQSAVEQYLMMESKSCTVPENSFTLNVWKGSIKDAITEAIQNKTLNSFIVSIAPTVSHKIWVETCAAYAEQLKEANEHSKASAYLLAIHKVEEAIQLLAENGKYRHAVAVARCRLPVESPHIKSLLLDWAQLCVTQGQQSLAAVCFASAEEWVKAAQCLARKKTSERLLMAARIIKEKCPGDPVGCFYARECFDLSLSLKDWASAQAALNLYPKLNHLALYLYVHQLIYSFKDSFSPDEWLKLGNKENEAKQCPETEEDDVHVSISLGDEKVAALRKDLATEVSVTSEDTAWCAVSSKVTLAYLAAPTLFPRISRKFVIDRAENDEQDLQTTYRLLVQAVSLLYHYHITNMLNEKGVPIFLKLCIWLAPQGPFHANSVFASSEIALQSSLRAHLAAGLLLWMLQSDLSDPCVKSLAIQSIGHLKADIFSTESLKSFKVDFKLKVLQERRVNQAVKGKQEKETQENEDAKGIDDETMQANGTANDPSEQFKLLKIGETQNGGDHVTKSPEDEEIEELNKWTEKFTEAKEKVPNPYLSYSYLMQYLNANKVDNGDILEEYTKFWEQANEQLNI